MAVTTTIATRVATLEAAALAERPTKTRKKVDMEVVSIPAAVEVVAVVVAAVVEV